jgi:hypothetical protein
LRQIRKMDLAAFEMQSVLGHSPYPDGDFRHRSVDRPFQPTVRGDGERPFIRRRIRHAGTEGVEPRLDNDQVVAFRPQRVVNGSLVYRMDEREHKFFAGADPGAKGDTSVTSIDDFKRGDKRPEQKPGNSGAGDYQTCDPSTMHLLKMRATLPAVVERIYRKGRKVLIFLN